MIQIKIYLTPEWLGEWLKTVFSAIILDLNWTHFKHSKRDQDQCRILYTIVVRRKLPLSTLNFNKENLINCLTYDIIRHDQVSPKRQLLDVSTNGLLKCQQVGRQNFLVIALQVNAWKYDAKIKKTSVRWQHVHTSSRRLSIFHQTN